MMTMTIVPSIAGASRNVALVLMLAVSALALTACAGDRAAADSNANAPIDFPFLGFDGAAGGGAGLPV